MLCHTAHSTRKLCGDMTDRQFVILLSNLTNHLFVFYPQVTDSHSVDVETLRKKTLEASQTNSLRGSTSSVVSLTDVVHPVVGSAAAVTTSPRHKPQEFENGDVIVTLLPINEKLPWITPAKFRPELVPEELMAPTLSVSFY